MKTQPTIVIYGNSLFSMGLEVSLKKAQAFTVIQIDTSRPDAEEYLRFLNPDVVVVDMTTLHWHVAVSFLRTCPRKPLIALDLHSNYVVVLSGQCSSVSTINDLVQVIQKQTLVPCEMEALQTM